MTVIGCECRELIRGAITSAGRPRQRMRRVDNHRNDARNATVAAGWPRRHAFVQYGRHGCTRGFWVVKRQIKMGSNSKRSKAKFVDALPFKVGGTLRCEKPPVKHLMKIFCI